MNTAKDTEDVVGVICVDKLGRVLLVQGVSGKWSFPKGRRKENETKYQGAIREAREESGIDLSKREVNAKINFRYGSYYVYSFGRSGDEIPLDEPMTPDEIMKVAWVNTKSIEFAAEDKNSDLRAYVQRY